MRYFIIFLFLPFLSFAQNAKVFAVHDGDSYKVLMDSATKKVWVRLWGVDCPEVTSNKISEAQPFGRFVGDSMRVMLKGKRVTVDSVGIDVFNRPVVKVKIDTIDLTEFLLKNGFAWSFNNNNIPLAEFSRLVGFQNDASRRKLGLWADDERINPSRWRRLYRY